MTTAIFEENSFQGRLSDNPLVYIAWCLLTVLTNLRVEKGWLPGHLNLLCCDFSIFPECPHLLPPLLSRVFFMVATSLHSFSVPLMTQISLTLNSAIKIWQWIKMRKLGRHKKSAISLWISNPKIFRIFEWDLDIARAIVFSHVEGHFFKLIIKYDEKEAL